VEQKQSMSKPCVLIADGGIGGLTAAIALALHGVDVHVYEQAPELREFGAGVSISPNGLWVLIELGLQSLHAFQAAER
jgi:salicylate hydroxylase